MHTLEQAKLNLEQIVDCGLWGAQGLHKAAQTGELNNKHTDECNSLQKRKSTTTVLLNGNSFCRYLYKKWPAI